MKSIAWLIISIMAGIFLAACDDTPIDERLRAKLPDINDAFFDDREDRELKKAIELVEDGADPNVVYHDPEWGHTYTLLGFTISYGSLQQVSALLDAGADPNLPTDATDLHAPPLCHVFYKLENKSGQIVEFIELMIDKGADVKGCPVIGIGAAFGRQDLVALFLEKGANLERFVSEREYIFHGPGEYLNRPLQAAAYGGNVGILEKFLSMGVKVEQPDHLILAAFESLNPKMMEKCLEVTPPQNLNYVYTGILMSFSSVDDMPRWRKQMDMLKAMKDSGYGLTQEIVDEFEREYPRHEVEKQILTTLHSA